MGLNSASGAGAVGFGRRRCRAAADPGSGKDQGHGRALAGHAGDRQFAFHHLRQRPRQGQAQPDAARCAGDDGGFAGEVAKFRYYARTLSPREAYQVYREGPGGNWFYDLLGQYKVKFSFLKRGEEINSFEI